MAKKINKLQRRIIERDEELFRNNKKSKPKYKIFEK